MWQVKVIGSPAPKGSMKAIKDRAGNARLLEDSPPALKSWRKLVAKAGHHIHTRTNAMRQGPVEVEATITLERPASVTAKQRPWPTLKSRGHGDVDKLGRAILDALTDSELWTDDAQVCRLTITKAYPDTPGVPDRLDQPGAIIRVGPIDDQPIDLTIRDDYGRSVEVSRAGPDHRVMVHYNDPITADGAVYTLTPQSAFMLARALDHEARGAREATLL